LAEGLEDHLPDEAKQIINRGLDLNPGNAHLWMKLGQIEKDQGNLLEAKVALQTAARLRPADSALFFALGKLLIELRSPEEAKPYLDKAAELSPGKQEELAQIVPDNVDSILAAKRDHPTTYNLTLTQDAQVELQIGH
jgi:cytochrome c-type biogenesis protein CcmH/NrfG